MSFLYLMVNRVARYCKKNKLLFFMFVAGGIVNAIMFCYLYGNLLPSVQKRNTDEVYYRLYDVILDETVDISQFEKKIIDTELFERISIGCSLYNKNEKETIQLMTMMTGDIPIRRTRGSDVLSMPNGILVPDSFTTEIGEQIQLLDETLIVEGFLSDSIFYISRDMYKKMLHDSADRITVVSKKNYPAAHDKAAEVLNQIFENGIVKPPTLAKLSDRNQSAAGLISICICFLLSACAFACILAFLMESCMDENIISIIVGSSKIIIGLMTFWEGCLLSFLSNIAGIIIHVMLTPALFSRLNVNPNVKYTPADYSLILLLMFVISSSIVFVMIFRFTSVSPTKARRKYE